MSCVSNFLWGQPQQRTGKALFSCWYTATFCYKFEQSRKLCLHRFGQTTQNSVRSAIFFRTLHFQKGLLPPQLSLLCMTRNGFVGSHGVQRSHISFQLPGTSYNRCSWCQNQHILVSKPNNVPCPVLEFWAQPCFCQTWKEKITVQVIPEDDL